MPIQMTELISVVQIFGIISTKEKPHHYFGQTVLVLLGHFGVGELPNHQVLKYPHTARIRTTPKQGKTVIIYGFVCEDGQHLPIKFLKITRSMNFRFDYLKFSRPVVVQNLFKFPIPIDISANLKVLICATTP